MEQPFIGSEALTAGELTRHALRSRFVALHQDVYLNRAVELTPTLRAKAAWLRSKRRGVLAGFSASALHGAKWIDPGQSATIIDTNRRPTHGVQVWAHDIPPDEICVIAGMRVTTPARTAFDLACHLPVDDAVTAIDSLGRATRLNTADIELIAKRYSGRRGVQHARVAIDLFDSGAQSPRETWLRLQLIRAGFPRPQTQIPIYNEFNQLVAVVDMGWEDIKLALDYEGAHHRTARQFDHDLRRGYDVTELGWTHLRVTSGDGIATIIRRVATLRERLTAQQRA